MALPKLYLNRDGEYDWLIALEFGAVDDGQPDDHRKKIGGAFAYLLDRPGGREIGFSIRDFSQFAPRDPAFAEIWRGPRFDVPTLGLWAASAGEIAVTARSFLGDRDTINRFYFALATRAEGEEAVSHWQSCLEAGDSMAHFGLGYTLLELGRAEDAYPHLEAYTDIVPTNPWAWFWLGQAAEALGKLDQARSAYELAIGLEESSGFETDARERLDALGRGEERPAGGQ